MGSRMQAIGKNQRQVAEKIVNGSSTPKLKRLQFTSYVAERVSFFAFQNFSWWIEPVIQKPIAALLFSISPLMKAMKHLCPLVFFFQICAAFGAENAPRLESNHISVTWEEAHTSRAEATTVLKAAESFFNQTETFFGKDFTPKDKLVVSLEGNSQAPDGNKRRPYVDLLKGWVHLYRFKEDSFAYQTGLSHELVHAFRFAHLKRYGAEPSSAFTFLEEGLAEYVSNVIEGKKSVFPNYSYELDVIAGQWIAADEDLPLSILVRSESELGQRCFAQAYSQRPSFIRYLDERFGRPALIKMAYAEDIKSDESFKKYFGKEFTELSAEWKASALSSYLTKDPKKLLGRQWRTSTKIAQMYICKRGVDW